MLSMTLLSTLLISLFIVSLCNCQKLVASLKRPRHSRGARFNVTRVPVTSVMRVPRHQRQHVEDDGGGKTQGKNEREEKEEEAEGRRGRRKKKVP